MGGWDFLSSLGSTLGGPAGGAIGNVLGSLFSSGAQSDAAQKASQDRLQATNQALQTQQTNYGNQVGQQNQILGQGLAQGTQTLGAVNSAYAPLVGAGNTAIAGLGQYGAGGLNAFNQQQALTGALGPQAQQEAINGVRNSPMFNSLASQGEDAIAQNASATGGLRGGNTQQVLANSRVQLLNGLLQQNFGNLGTISSLGANSLNPLASLGGTAASGLGQGALGVLGSNDSLLGGTAGNLTSLANNNNSAVTDLIGQTGAINAGRDIAQGNATANMYTALGSAPSQYNLLNTLSQRLGGLGGTSLSGGQGNSLLTALRS